MMILAMDLGKFKTVACFYDTTTHEERYATVGTTPTALVELLSDRKVDRVVIEVGSVAGWVHDLFKASVPDIQVANVNHESWRWQQVKVKTDRKDALKLAKMSALDQLPTVHMPSAQVRQKRMVIVYRRKLISRRTAVKNGIRAILLSQGIKMEKGKKAWTAEGLEYLARLSAPVEQVDVEDLWRGRLALELESLTALEAQIAALDRRLDEIAKKDPGTIVVTTIAGVGNRLGEALSAVIDDPHRFKTGRQVSSYVGLTPRQMQSGQMSRQGRITKAGCADLRCLLVEASWLALRYNPWLREIYERVRRGDKKRNKVAIVAVARHLLVTAWAMLRDGTVWEPPALKPPKNEEPPAEAGKKRRKKVAA